MEMKKGKTYIELVIDDCNREFYDISFSISTGENMVSCSIGNEYEFIDKNREKELQNNPDSIKASDYLGTIMKKSIIIRRLNLI